MRPIVFPHNWTNDHGVLATPAEMLHDRTCMGLGFCDEPLCLGDEATAQWPELAESLAWAANVDRLQDLIIAFDGDDLAPGVRAAGLYCKHRGDMAAARGFLCQSGAADLADGYATVAYRLSEGWLPLYAGNYHGRNHDSMRLRCLTPSRRWSSGSSVNR